MPSFLKVPIFRAQTSGTIGGRPLSALLADTGSRVTLTSGTATAGYAAFISYSHRDSAEARWLHKAIENFRLPTELVGTEGELGPVPARLRPVFRDEDELASASELGPRLEQALAASRALIVICSPAAVASAWVDKEIRTFKRMNPTAPVLAVLARGTPEESFPLSLRFAVTSAGELDEARPVEPLAPDLTVLDRRTVKLKLIAGLAGVSYAALERRDLRRRRRITIWLTTAGITLIAVLSGLSIAAVSYARLAVRERNTAVHERNQAIAARELAEKRTWLAQQAADQIRAFAFSANCAGKADHPK